MNFVVVWDSFQGMILPSLIIFFHHYLHSDLVIIFNSYLIKRMKQEFNLSIDMSAFHRSKIILPTFCRTGLSTRHSYRNIFSCWLFLSFFLSYIFVQINYTALHGGLHKYQTGHSTSSLATRPTGLNSLVVFVQSSPDGWNYIFVLLEFLAIFI